MGDFLPADAASLWKSAPIFSTDYMEAELVSQRSSVERARALQAPKAAWGAVGPQPT